MTTPDANRSRKLGYLLEVVKLMSSEIELDSLLNLILLKTTEVMEAERSSLFLYDPDTNELWSKIAQGLDLEEIRFPIGVGIAGAVAESKLNINIPDVSKDPRFNAEFDSKHSFVTRSILGVPLIGNSGILIGVIEVINKKGGICFDEEDEEFLTSFASQVAIALQRAQMVEILVQNQRIEESLKQAKEIQMSMLPKKFPPFPEKAHLIDIYAEIQPAHNVGGDLFNFILVDDQHLCFTIGDVSDKGIPAALFMAVIVTAFNAMVKGDMHPSEIMVRLNDYINCYNDTGMFCTFFCGILDLQTGELEFCNAGHSYPYILRADGTIFSLNTGVGIPLGIAHLPSYPSDSTVISDGDAIILYTDGITEAMDSNFSQYGNERLESLIRQLVTSSAKEATRKIINSVKTFSGTSEQWDDLTVLVIKGVKLRAAASL